MIRVASLILFGGCALAVARYNGLGGTLELLLVVGLAFGLMRILSGKRVI
jgi:hypothetical protein